MRFTPPHQKKSLIDRKIYIPAKLRIASFSTHPRKMICLSPGIKDMDIADELDLDEDFE